MGSLLVIHRRACPVAQLGLMLVADYCFLSGNWGSELAHTYILLFLILSNVVLGLKAIAVVRLLMPATGVETVLAGRV